MFSPHQWHFGVGCKLPLRYSSYLPVLLYSFAASGEQGRNEIVKVPPSKLEGGNPGRASCRTVAFFVPDENTAARVDGPLCKQIQDHPGFGLSPGVCRCIPLDGTVWVVWAIPPVIDRRTMLPKATRHRPM